jgi:hypothetical protein
MKLASTEVKAHGLGLFVLISAPPRSISRLTISYTTKNRAPRSSIDRYLPRLLMKVDSIQPMAYILPQFKDVNNGISVYVCQWSRLYLSCQGFIECDVDKWLAFVPHERGWIAFPLSIYWACKRSDSRTTLPLRCLMFYHSHTAWRMAACMSALTVNELRTYEQIPVVKLASLVFLFSGVL